MISNNQEQNTWWQEALEKWRTVHLLGTAMRSDYLMDSITEAATAAGVTVHQIATAAADWPGQEEDFISAVVNTHNIEVRPWNAPERLGGCTCFDSPPCNYCCTNDYWVDWRLPDDPKPQPA
jgi:hypothetical protein